jgi:uncharacterized protein with HEPN domain
MWRDDAHLLDMLLASQKIMAFTHGKGRDEFDSDEILQQAIMRLVQIIGEAARKVSPEFKQDHSHIPWTDIVGMRHRLVHEYFRIVPELVWQVVDKDIPALVGLIEPLVPPDEPRR